MIRSVISKILLFISLILVMVASLVLVAMIPQERIREKSLESAKYLAEGELFPDAIEGVPGSGIDRYADAILLNIAYCYDSGSPLRSVMLSAYYFTPDHEENENYLSTVSSDQVPNQQYLRYWHGSNVIVRPLLMFLSVKQIYILNAVVLAVLFAAFIVMALRRGQKVLAFAMTASLVLTGCWFVPMSLEYTWTFLIMLIASLVALKLADKERQNRYAAFFMTVGMITAFFDFLTTETITVLIPLLVIISTMRSKGYAGDDRTYFGKIKVSYYEDMSIRSIFMWGCGYAATWVSKWILTSIVFGENAMPYVTEHIGERMSGTMGVETDTFGFFAGAITRNIRCLFPLGYKTAGMIAGIAVAVFAAYIAYVYRSKDRDKKAVRLYLLIGIIPYVRFLLLHNHSYIHYFFTYRAQAATALAVILAIAQMTGKGAKKNA